MDHDLKTKLLDRLIFYGKDIANPKFAASNKNTIKHWFDCFNQCNDFQRCQETFTHLEEISLNQQSQKAPSIGNFKAEYRKQNASYDMSPVVHKCILCNLGWRSAIEGGYYADVALLSLKTLNNACLTDRNKQQYPNEHVFPFYNLRPVPCTCESGQKINKEYHELSPQKMQRIFDNSFVNDTEALEFMKSKAIKRGHSKYT